MAHPFVPYGRQEMEVGDHVLAGAKAIERMLLVGGSRRVRAGVVVIVVAVVGGAAVFVRWCAFRVISREGRVLPFTQLRCCGRGVRRREQHTALFGIVVLIWHPPSAAAAARRGGWERVAVPSGSGSMGSSSCRRRTQFPPFQHQGHHDQLQSQHEAIQHDQAQFRHGSLAHEVDQDPTVQVSARGFAGAGGSGEDVHERGDEVGERDEGEERGRGWGKGLEWRGEGRFRGQKDVVEDGADEEREERDAGKQWGKIVSYPDRKGDWGKGSFVE